MGRSSTSLTNIITAGLVAVAAGTACAQVAFETIPAVLPGDASWAFGVSADGSWVCGRSGTNYYYGSSGHGYRWNHNSGVEDLDPLVGESTAYGISSDGQWVVGYENAGSRGWRSFTWDPVGGMQHRYNDGMLLASSSDGGFCVGYETTDTGIKAVRCVMNDRHASPLFLDANVVASSSQANGSSTDGSVIVGSVYLSSIGQRAFRWTEGTGMVNIGDVGVGRFSQGLGVSGDGSIVVGSQSEQGATWLTHAFRWTNTGMTLLASNNPNFRYSAALGISADGSTIVGKSQAVYGGVNNAFMWRANIGVQHLQTVLAAVLPAGAQVADATATSANGHVIVGSYRDPNSGYNMVRSFTATIGECVAPMIVTQPVDQALNRPHQNVILSAPVGGFAPFTYVWQKSTGVDAWETVSDSAGHIGGSATGAITISDATSADNGVYRCVITNSCGTTVSATASVNVCFSDFNLDAVSDFFDYLDFVDALSAGSANADYNRDGSIDFFDYLDFVDAYSTGC